MSLEMEFGLAVLEDVFLPVTLTSFTVLSLGLVPNLLLDLIVFSLDFDAMLLAVLLGFLIASDLESLLIDFLDLEDFALLLSSIFDLLTALLLLRLRPLSLKLFFDFGLVFIRLLDLDSSGWSSRRCDVKKSLLY